MQQLPFEVPWNFPVWYDEGEHLFARDQPLAVAFVCPRCNNDRGILNEDIYLVVEFDEVEKIVKYHTLDWDKREVVV